MHGPIKLMLHFSCLERGPQNLIISLQPITNETSTAKYFELLQGLRIIYRGYIERCNEIKYGGHYYAFYESRSA